MFTVFFIQFLLKSLFNDISETSFVPRINPIGRKSN